MARNFLSAAVDAVYASVCSQTATLSFSIDDVVPFDSTSGWTLHNGKKKADGTPVSIFVCSTTTAKPEMLAVARNALKRTKTLRHPSLLRYIDGTETPNGIFIATERVRPLFSYLSAPSTVASAAAVAATASEVNCRSAEHEVLAWGLHQILKALAFLNDSCNVVHCSVGSGCSVFADEAGEWKLGNLGYVSSPSDVEQEAVDINRILGKHLMDWVGTTACLPPEQSGGVHMHATDMYGFGILVWQVFFMCSTSSTFNSYDMSELLRKVRPQRSDLECSNNRIPESLRNCVNKLLSSDISGRNSATAVLRQLRKRGRYLYNNFVETCIFLEELTLKSDEEKVAFYDSLTKQYEHFPADYCRHRILPQLVAALGFGNASPTVLAPLLALGRLLSESEYQRIVVPGIVRLFSSTDRALRSSLLLQMPVLCEQLPDAIADKEVYISVSQGFADTSPVIREQTVKAIVSLAPKLSENTINNSLLGCLAKSQRDPEPGIRTNTTICIGKILPGFSAAVRDKIVVPAFTRPFNDSFAPVRSAGIMGLLSSLHFISREDLACKVLPAAGPLALDPVDSVRISAFRLMYAVIKQLEETTTDSNSEADTQSALTNSKGVLAASAAASVAASWTGWAVSSIAKKVAASSTNSTTAIASDKIEIEAVSSNVPSKSNVNICNDNDLSDTDIDIDEQAGDGWDHSDNAFDTWDAADVPYEKVISGVESSKNDWDDWGSLMKTDFIDSGVKGDKRGNSLHWGNVDDSTLKSVGTIRDRENDERARNKEERRLAQEQRRSERASSGKGGAMKLGARKVN